MGNSRKVLVIGWDAADWKVIHPLMDQGKMPHLKSLVEEGAMAEISTLHPVLSPMLWTSIATGKRPYKHGVHGFIEPTPDGTSVQTITNLSRKSKAVWNILNQSGYRSIVVGWWPSHPAEPIDGVMVSNNYHKVHTTDLEQEWPMARGTVHPMELADELKDLRFHPSELDEDVIRTFIPYPEKIDQEKDSRLWVFMKMLAEATTIQAASTHLLEHQEWDFGAVYFDAIDHFSHAFMKYHPPKQPHISGDDFEIFQHVIQCSYIYHDMMLGHMLKTLNEQSTVMVVSDHGFHPDHLRPRHIPNEPAGPAIEHRDFGIFAIKGPGIRKDALVHGVNLLDITPTILHLFGLPVGDDMDGRVISDAMIHSSSIESIESWDTVAGKDGQHPANTRLSVEENEAAIQQLVELGYVEQLDDDKTVNVKNADRELKYNLARSYMDADRYGDAVGILHQLFCDSPSEYRFGIQLAMCFKALHRTDDLDQLIKRLRKQRLADAEKAREELKKWQNLAYKRNSASEGEAGNKPIELSEVMNSEIFSEDEKSRIRQLVAFAHVNHFALDFLEGYTLVAQGEFAQAVQLLGKAIKSQPDRPGFYTLVADAYIKMKDWEAGLHVLERALQLDPQGPQILFGLGRCHLGLRNNVKAVEYLLKAVGQMFHFPIAHYYLGVAFHRIDRIERAIDAFKVSVSQNPNNSLALGRLGYIYKSELDDVESAREYFELARQAREHSRELRRKALEFQIPKFDPDDNSAIAKFSVDSLPEPLETLLPTLKQTSAEDVRKRIEQKGAGPFVTIVTGLPRTGTSMMMQMLDHGGIPALTDQIRQADHDNPNGYLEYEAVKKLATDNRWVIDASGKSVKVIAQLLQFLPKQQNYRVVFMDRPMEEILASQKAMLERNRKSGGDLVEEQLARVFNQQLRSAVDLLKLSRIPTIRVPYHDVIRAPASTCKSLDQFLQTDLDLDQMVQVIDADLHRQKGAAASQSNTS